MNISKRIKGLKCDNPNCSYVDPTIPREMYEKYINYPCPLCGQPLLTQKDYDALCKLEKGMELLAKITGSHLEEEDGNKESIMKPDSHGIQMQYGSDGKGNLRVKKMNLF